MAAAPLMLALWFLPGTQAVAQEGEYSSRGADTCLRCHGAKSEWGVVDIFKTKHGARVDEHGPFGGNAQCEACHGPGAGHEEAMKEDDPAGLGGIIVFGRDAMTPVAEQNAVCLDCHTSHERIGWLGSAHDEADVSCADCHQVHVAQDPVFDNLGQQQVCFDCHQQQRAQVFQPSNHPLRFGEMTCTDCHSPHNGFNDAQLVEATVNDTCYTCHAEKRGPFLFEHAPASEDCGLCHRPHGSNHAGMLTQREPQLCQTCHMPSGHPSLALGDGSVDDFFQSRFLLGASCGNCHDQVHGSNHPSGVYLGR
jgi:DmsE family decaheme c-type cytochrome